MTARTILDHTDDILALPRGTWLVVRAPIWGTPNEGGLIEIPTGTRLRVAWASGEYLNTHTEAAHLLAIRREQLAHVEREPADG